MLCAKHSWSVPPSTGPDFAQRLFGHAVDALVAQQKYSAKQSAMPVLLGFMLQRRADFRINPNQRQDGIITVFHPKMYVVEQEGGEDRTVSIVGSHNWTESALDVAITNAITNEAIQENTVRSNVDVDTLHADKGHLRGNAESEETLGHRVYGAAHELFADSQFWIGTWEDPAPDSKLLPIEQLELATQPLSDFEHRVGEPETGG